MTLARQVQLGPCRVCIETDSRDVYEQLRYLDHDAVQSVPAITKLDLGAWREDHSFQLVRQGRLIGRVSQPEDVLDHFYAIAYRDAFAAMAAGTLLLHGVTVARRGRRALLVGQPHAGKSTLAARLLIDGFEVSGDEYAVLADERLAAFPRRFHLKAGSLALLPQLTRIVPSLPFFDTSSGRIVALGPTDLGRPWVLDPGPVDAIVVLEANHGGPSTLSGLPQHELVRLLMMQTFTPDPAPRGWITSLSQLVGSATCSRMAVGDLDTAVIAVEALLS